jgi:hypothetical protein
MDTSKKPWPVSTVFGIRSRIDTNPDYQRPAVWTRAQKQLLIDTVLRNYDIPKFYWRRTGRKPDIYEVVDGQQRLRALWEFCEGLFSLPKDADAIDGIPVRALFYADLPDELRIRFDTYPLDVVLVEDADGDEVREMFLRLQNGTSLKAQEKRNAYPGRMRDFVRSLVGHPLFNVVGFPNTRYTHDLVAAQFVCLDLAGGPTNIKDADLNRMYRANEDFNEGRSDVRRVLDVLSRVFDDRTPELTRYNVVTLFCMVSELLASYVRNEWEPVFRSWFLQFERTRSDQEALSVDVADAEWVTYKEKISHSTDTEDSIRWRMDFMFRDFLLRHGGLRLKDGNRAFTPQQRLAVFRRDGGVCQLRIKCDGARLRWDDWQCDHRIPWSKGGTTTVENGQAACAACNAAKGASCSSPA